MFYFEGFVIEHSISVLPCPLWSAVCSNAFLSTSKCSWKWTISKHI